MGELITVDFRPDGRDTEPSIRVKRRVFSECAHASIIADEKLRRVTCKDCDEVLDPVEVVIGWARGWERFSNAVKYLRMEEEHKRRELAQLLRRARNVRSQIRRDLQKAPHV